MKKLLAATALIIALGNVPAMAEHKEGHLSREEVKKMSPEERKAYFENKKAEWQKLPKEEKIKVIEQRRAERIKKMDAKWKSMNDDEKIKFVEKRMERRAAGKGHHGYGGHKE